MIRKSMLTLATYLRPTKFNVIATASTMRPVARMLLVVP
eukprot:CAMPEP_0180508304 /NCGR_PEP_ID=MMETSP1036_2-20121128/49093_1 /TAXON_ID=632150 /ORGANISM="Azadinium spinosum, Strain 3D9" /LENGTH=38 /DNA_ID= /DNA_START= /DNA_END= /DNA_ORIENTATION=